MNYFYKTSLFLLRVGLGWLFFYAGVTKILDPEWSAAGYLSGAKTFPALYEWFSLSQNIEWINFLNEWGLTLIGAALILGFFVRWASFAGILIMLLYYFPILDFPYAGNNAYIVDQHIIYMLSFLVLIAARAGRFWGIDAFRE